ncbi:hypothetical protein WA026_001899 [Henosepilachna vigintioctopunctata]|uniref:Uncharacterized protein n=1 Tax=Henosepilachna vigintioctopunctata TaxID=420089 RepID=A0AAW1UUP3_9CUCU
MKIDLEVANSRLDASTKIQIEKERQIQSLYTIIEIMKSQNKSEELPKMDSGARTSKTSENVKPKDVATNSSSPLETERQRHLLIQINQQHSLLAFQRKSKMKKKIENTPKIK